MTDSNSERTGVSRRHFIKGAGLSAFAVGVAACTGTSVTTTSSTAGTTTTSSSTTTTAPPEPTTTTSTAPTTTTVPPTPLADLAASRETWNQPWVWRPRGDAPLVLNVVENRNGLLFSYGGSTPGPTIRMLGDETLFVRVENWLGPDQGLSTVNANPDPVSPSIPGPEGATIKSMFKARAPSVYGGTPQDPVVNKIPAALEEDWCLGEHVNGVHSAHVTNLHTHGLHVTSGRNPNGTHSDNIYLRIVPSEDWQRIQANPECVEEFQEALSLKGGEIVDAVGEFEFVLGRTPATPVHPPGTHWYHPHSHGSTHNQVSSGMAGFLIIEGDVDEFVNEQLTGDPSANPERRTGPWDYRERTVFIQRVFNNPSTDPDQVDRTNIRPKQASTFTPRTNGSAEPNVITMRPGAIERWRVLNGSVDGSGFIRVLVLRGRFEIQDQNGTQTFVAVTTDGSGGQQVVGASENEAGGTMTIGSETVPIADLKQRLWQLSRDGVTLVRGEPGSAEYFVKDLSRVNDGREPDFASTAECYQGDNLLLCYRRPNELALADANRADVFFQAPPLADGSDAEIYTVLGMQTNLHDSGGATTKLPTVVAHVVVRGEPVEGPPDAPLSDLELPPVPDYLQPIPDGELEVTDAERDSRPDLAGTYRTRVLRYAGWGAAGFPRVDVPADIADANEDLNKLAYYRPPAPDEPGLTIPVTAGGKTTYEPVSNVQRVTASGLELPILAMSPNTRTMSVDGHKFEPTSDATPVMWRGSAEEWVIWNEAVACFSITPKPDVTPEEADANALEQVWYSYDQDGEAKQDVYGQPTAYPLYANQVPEVNATRGGDGQPLPLADAPATRSADHPFHIHQNPFWLTHLEVPNADGDLINILEEPVWGDVTFLPRDGGRAVFRSRFEDYVGEYVNHCHILLHEDNGMMQRLRVVAGPGQEGFDPGVVANYAGGDAVASAAGVPESTYPRPTLDEMWQRCVSFVDDNNAGQVFPVPQWAPPAPDPAQRP